MTKWSQQLSLFRFAVATYGHVDVVVANAGVNEVGEFDPFAESKSDEPTEPNLTTLNINLNAVVYSEL